MVTAVSCDSSDINYLAIHYVILTFYPSLIKTYISKSFNQNKIKTLALEVANQGSSQASGPLGIAIW